jgi:drug/metabolite transporter (DMT)-like permease
MGKGAGIARPLSYTSLAMLAFAGNSVICRMALRDELIDPASFTALRLVSGAVVLLVIFGATRQSGSLRTHGSWISALMLFLYALGFSYAYISLETGVGALILFAFVQGTMIAMGMWSGDRPSMMEWIGWIVACAGLAWLLFPGVTAPPLPGAVLMAIAGIAWGIYSVRGRRETHALAATTANFVMSVAMVLLLAAVTYAHASFGVRGVLLALVSGALTSGIGYVIWYAALEYLSAMQAALVQLSVPLIAAAGGILLLAEPLTQRLVVAAVLVLGGLCLALSRKSLSRPNS